MKARIQITPKKGVLDPQGKAIVQALIALGFSSVKNVRQGKFLEIDLHDNDRNQLISEVNEMCEKLLANTVIEDYKIDFE